jgi:hypothetical protein
MTQTVNVEYEELMARAAEIEQPLPTIPSTNPQGPCNLPFVNDAAGQLAINADSVRTYLKACEREWKHLAESLRNAAKAYQAVDENAADAIDGGGSVSPKTPVTTDEPHAETLNPAPKTLLGASPSDYNDVKSTAKIIETGDQGAAFLAFVDEWDAFQRNLQKEERRFRPFDAWEGEARAAVMANFDAQRQWIDALAKSCVALGDDAVKVVDAHKKAAGHTDFSNRADEHEYVATEDYEHPTSYEISELDRMYKFHAEHYPEYLQSDMVAYQHLQQHSEKCLDIYKRAVAVPSVSVPAPPTAVVINPPQPDNPDNPVDPVTPDVSPDGGLPDLPTAPQMPDMPKGEPKMPDGAALAGALGAHKGVPKGMAGMKPTSLGGGKVGVPSPLQPPLEAESSQPTAAAKGTMGMGRGVPGLGGAAGGGMGGAAPMGGHGGQGKGANKGKRVQGEGGDDALYTEERPWTEGLIGNRPPKMATTDGKAPPPVKPPQEPGRR